MKPAHFVHMNVDFSMFFKKRQKIIYNVNMMNRFYMMMLLYKNYLHFMLKTQNTNFLWRKECVCVCVCACAWVRARVLDTCWCSPFSSRCHYRDIIIFPRRRQGDDINLPFSSSFSFTFLSKCFISVYLFFWCFNVKRESRFSLSWFTEATGGGFIS